MTVSADYFAIFGVPHGFDIDPAGLERKFHELSRQHHPDRFARASAAERSEALTRMSEINDAYQTLKEPARRRDYVLKLQGLEADPKAKGPIPTDLAESWFEVQEALMEDPAGASAQVARFEAQLGASRRLVDEKIAELERELSQAMRAPGGASRERLLALHAETLALNYLDSLERDIQRVKGKLP